MSTWVGYNGWPIVRSVLVRPTDFAVYALTSDRGYPQRQLIQQLSGSERDNSTYVSVYWPSCITSCFRTCWLSVLHCTIHTGTSEEILERQLVVESMVICALAKSYVNIQPRGNDLVKLETWNGKNDNYS